MYVGAKKVKNPGEVGVILQQKQLNS